MGRHARPQQICLNPGGWPMGPKTASACLPPAFILLISAPRRPMNPIQLFDPASAPTPTSCLTWTPSEAPVHRPGGRAVAARSGRAAQPRSETAVDGGNPCPMPTTSPARACWPNTPGQNRCPAGCGIGGSRRAAAPRRCAGVRPPARDRAAPAGPSAGSVSYVWSMSRRHGPAGRSGWTAGATAMCLPATRC